MTTISELLEALESARSGSPEMSVESAIAIYHAAKSQVDAYNGVADQAKQIINDVMTETGQLFYATAAGKAQITAASTSASYDTKALDALIASSPELKAILEPHRKTSERAGTLRVTAAK